MNQRISQIKTQALGALRSAKGKNFLLYLLFVAVAAVFWLVMSLDAEVQKVYDVPIEITGVPDSITVISEPPRAISVNVKGKGTQLLRFSWGNLTPLKIDFRDFNDSDRHIFVSRSKLDARMRDYFGNGTSILSVRPDTLSLLYTSSPGKKVKLIVDAKVEADIQCIVNGEIKANLDSVRVFSVDGAKYPDAVYTETVTRSDLRDVTIVEARIKQVPGMRIIPDKVTVTIPVETLISKSREVQVAIINTPAGFRMLTFPSKIEVTYLVPMSEYNDDYPLRAYVDYRDTLEPGSSVPIMLSPAPDFYHNISFTPERAEYIIERIPEHQTAHDATPQK